MNDASTDRGGDNGSSRSRQSGLAQSALGQAPGGTTGQGGPLSDGGDNRSGRFESPERSRPERSRPVLPWLLAAAGVSFSIGVLGSPWLERQVRGHLPPALRAPEQALSGPDIKALEQKLAQLESRVQDAPAMALETAVAAGSAADALTTLESRIAQLESRTGTLAGQLAEQGAGHDDRWQSLSRDIARLEAEAGAEDRDLRAFFLLSLARRAVEAGRPLGPLEPLLSARFAPVADTALADLTNWSSLPQTHGSLATRLAQMAEPPAAEEPGRVTGEAAGAGWWENFLGRLRTLVKVRPSGDEALATGAGDPRALAEAQAELEKGDLVRAINAIERAPRNEARDLWIVDARRLAAAEAALDRLESLALGDAMAALSRPAAVSATVAPPPLNATAPQPVPAP